METLTAQEVQEQLQTLIASVTRRQCKYRITSSEGTVVMLSEESYDNLMVTLEMLSTPIFLDSMQ